MKMKKILTISFLLLLTISFKNVSALEDDIIIVNKNNVSITEERYLELMDAGYTIDDIYNMDLETYNNANTNNENIASETKYFKTITTTRYGNTNTETIEVTEEEFNEGDNGNISIYASGTVETSYKKLVASITPSTTHPNRMKYRVYMYWKTLPSVRSYDIIGMGFDSMVVERATSPEFYQLYTRDGYTYTSYQAYLKDFTNGSGAVFQLPTNVTTISQDFTFEVLKRNPNETVTRQTSAGDYAHAIETVNGSTANNNYYAGLSGLSLYSAISSKYDGMSAAQVIWDGSW